MKYETTYKLENFVLGTNWDDLPSEVQERIKGCFVDLTGALITGSRSSQFKVGLKLAEDVFGLGDIPVVGSDKTFTFYGSASSTTAAILTVAHTSSSGIVELYRFFGAGTRIVL